MSEMFTHLEELVNQQETQFLKDITVTEQTQDMVPIFHQTLSMKYAELQKATEFASQQGEDQLI